MTDDRLNTIRAIIRHRVPEATEAEIIEALNPADLDGDTGIPPRIAAQILDLVGMMADRLDKLEADAAPPRLN